MAYKWEKSLINSLEEQVRELLEKELEKEISSIDPSKSTSLSQSEFKRLYKTYLIYLKRISDFIYKSQDKLIKTTLDTSLVTYGLPNQGITDDILIEIVLRFIEYCNDKDLLENYKRLIDKDNHLLNISSFNQETPICNYIKGRHISHNGKQFVSIYTSGTIEDTLLLSHEYGHFLAASLKRGPITNHFLKEFESFFLELLITDFIGKTLNDEKLKGVLMSNKVLSTQSDILLAGYYKEMVKINFTPSKEYLNERLKKKYNATTIISPEITDLYSDGCIDDIKRLHSRLFAFAIYDLYKDDIEKAIRAYKEIITNNTEFIDTLADKFEIDYKTYTNGYLKELTKTKEFAKTIK